VPSTRAYSSLRGLSNIRGDEKGRSKKKGSQGGGNESLWRPRGLQDHGGREIKSRNMGRRKKTLYEIAETGGRRCWDLRGIEGFARIRKKLGERALSKGEQKVAEFSEN